MYNYQFYNITHRIRIVINDYLKFIVNVNEVVCTKNIAFNLKSIIKLVLKLQWKLQHCLPCNSVIETAWKYFKHCKNGAFISVALLIMEAANMWGSFTAYLNKTNHELKTKMYNLCFKDD